MDYIGMVITLTEHSRDYCLWPNSASHPSWGCSAEQVWI